MIRFGSVELSIYAFYHLTENSVTKYPVIQFYLRPDANPRRR